MAIQQLQIQTGGDILIYYDGPQLIAYDDPCSLALAVDDSNYLVFGCNPDGIKALKNGDVDLLTLVNLASDWVLSDGEITTPMSGPIPEEYKPGANLFLGGK